MSNNLKERREKWRSLTRSELGKTINLILILAVGALGYQFSLLIDPSYHINSSQYLFIFSLILITSSILSGIIVSLSRLIDFRWTANLIDMKINKESKDTIKEWKRKNKNLGAFTWKCFTFQIATFFVGVIVFASFIFQNHISSKLFCN